MNDKRQSFEHDYSLSRVPDEQRKSLVSLAAVWVGWWLASVHL